jgi:ribosomal protein S25
LGRVTHPGYDPWRAIEQHPQLRVTFDPVAGLMGGGFHVARGPRAFIVVDPELDEPGRRAVLTHELIHHERGGGPADPGPTLLVDAVVDREEHQVSLEVARRLVPDRELAAAVAELVSGAGSVTAEQVAERFTVPVEVAGLALRRLSDAGGLAPQPAASGSRKSHMAVHQGPGASN